MPLVDDVPSARVVVKPLGQRLLDARSQPLEACGVVPGMLGELAQEQHEPPEPIRRNPRTGLQVGPSTVQDAIGQARQHLGSTRRVANGT